MEPTIKAITNLAIEIGNFVHKLCKVNPIVHQAYEDQMDIDCETDDWDFQYAEAVLMWRAKGRRRSYFSTTSPILLACRKELEKEFGLEIMDTKSGLERERANGDARTVVDGWGSGQKATAKDLKEQEKRDITFLTKNTGKNWLN